MSLSKPLLMSHITAVLSTDPDTIKFPSRVQHMSYTSSMCPLRTNHMTKTRHFLKCTWDGWVLCLFRGESLQIKRTGKSLKYFNLSVSTLTGVVYLNVLNTDQLSLLSWASSSSWNMGACSGSFESFSFHSRMAASVPNKNHMINNSLFVKRTCAGWPWSFT